MYKSTYCMKCTHSEVQTQAKLPLSQMLTPWLSRGGVGGIQFPSGHRVLAFTCVEAPPEAHLWICARSGASGDEKV